LTSLLREVSRSFYLTIRVLPKAVRSQIGLAYLLARTTDTIADTEIVPVAGRLEALQKLAERIRGEGQGPLDFSAFVPSTAPEGKQRESDAERVLLTRVEEAISLLATFSLADQKLIRTVLVTITSGQELDLRRFGGAGTGLKALANGAELDDYIYRVAGCVGEFWTRICCEHLFRKRPGVAALDLEPLLANGVRFAKGLQLVNILRDVPADLRNGRCYIPEDALQAVGLRPADLLSPKTEGAFRPLYNQLLDQADAHLRAGWTYTTSLPRKHVRVRLACAWPILLGHKTLGLLRNRNVLEVANRLKVSRSDMRWMMLRTFLYYPFPRAWNGLLPREAPPIGAGNAISRDRNLRT
jgi:farnesyl-diphosphate farnesyltransferase